MDGHAASRANRPREPRGVREVPGATEVREAFDRAVASFASAYADQNERDYEAFAQAVESGRLEAMIGL